jgi:sterol desaturase/sphingolipid hydroxylase (fatty acid hydroxylase superfamily)
LQWLADNAVLLRLDGQLMWFIAFWGVLALLAALEAFVPAYRQPPDRHRRWPTNFGLGLINALWIPLAPVSAVWAAEWAQQHGVGILHLMDGPWWLAAVATVVIRSLVGYAGHVLLHKAPFLWRVHRVHHSDTRLDVSTGLRTHPVELLVTVSITVPVSVVFGLTAWAVAVYEVAEMLVAIISHANLRLPPPLDRALSWVLITPNMHGLHHSAYQPETDSNYGTLLSVWDRLFGTYRRSATEDFRIGLDDVPDERSSLLWWQLISPALRIRSASDAIGPVDDPLVRRNSSAR